MEITINVKALLAEFLGTFILSAVVLFSISADFSVATALLVALTLVALVYMFAEISGAHLNPAVTIGLAAVRKISAADAIGYLSAQFLAAGATVLLGNYLLEEAVSLGGINTLPVMTAEALGTMVLCLGIAAVVYKKAPQQLSGVIIGLSLLGGIALAFPASNAILNPAVAVALGSFSLAYLVGPLSGALVAFFIYAKVFGGK